MNDKQQTLARRTLLGGAATAGAAVGALALLGGKTQPVEQTVAQAPTTGSAEPEGYRLTEHIKQYYASTRI